MPGTVGIVTLGCAKNQVNSEQMLHLLDEAGFEITGSVENTDIVIVNTCGFIESAKSEAIENIIELGMLKSEGKIGKIIVAGCLAQRYAQELMNEMPEVDGIVGCGSYNSIVSAADAVLRGERPVLMEDIDSAQEEVGRVLMTPQYFAYIKIAEGCDNRCSYCVIPSLRGKYRSRLFEDIVEEAELLAAGGVKELIVVAQDTSRYGLDLYGERRLADLLARLCKIEGLVWIRLHYLYPDEITDELINVIAREEKIVNYLDIPIQHINDKILESMNRRGNRSEIEALLSKLRDRIPGLVLRTSLICGLPGETESEFDELCGFLREYRLERVGVFAYSPEEGTPAALMENRAEPDMAQARVRIIEELQSRIMDDYNQSFIGKTITVLCEGYDRYAQCHFGRSYADSPEVDGKVFFSSGNRLLEGVFVDVEITDTIDGDLWGQTAV